MSADLRPVPRPWSGSTMEWALEIILRHQQRAQDTLNMVPAENAMPNWAKIPMITDLYDRYMFNETQSADDWRFPGARDAAALETELTVPLLRDLSAAPHVNVRPLSGLSAMTLALTALAGPPGTAVAVLHPDMGGHYATAEQATRLGLRPLLLTGLRPHVLDLDHLGETVARHRPQLVYLDQCHALTPLDIRAISRTVTCANPDTRVHVDASHWMGLILGGALPNPLDQGAHSFGGSTHKTFPGPQKGIIATRDDDIAAALRRAQPNVISSHHFAATAALGLAALEFILADGRGYATATVANAKALAHALVGHGIPVAGADIGYTAGHQLWIPTGRTPTAQMAAEQLYAAGIHVNFLNDLPLGEPALRLGLNEATWQGLSTIDMTPLAQIIATAITVSGNNRPRLLTDLAKQTADLRLGAHPRRHQAPQSARSQDLMTQILGHVLPSRCHQAH